MATTTTTTFGFRAGAAHDVAPFPPISISTNNDLNSNDSNSTSSSESSPHPNLDRCTAILARRDELSRVQICAGDGGGVGGGSLVVAERLRHVYGVPHAMCVENLMSSETGEVLPALLCVFDLLEGARSAARARRKFRVACGQRVALVHLYLDANNLEMSASKLSGRRRRKNRLCTELAVKNPVAFVRLSRPHSPKIINAERASNAEPVLGVFSAFALLVERSALHVLPIEVDEFGSDESRGGGRGGDNEDAALSFGESTARFSFGTQSVSDVELPSPPHFRDGVLVQEFFVTTRRGQVFVMSARYDTRAQNPAQRVSVSLLCGLLTEPRPGCVARQLPTEFHSRVAVIANDELVLSGQPPDRLSCDDLKDPWQGIFDSGAVHVLPEEFANLSILSADWHPLCPNSLVLVVSESVQEEDSELADIGGDVGRVARRGIGVWFAHFSRAATGNVQVRFEGRATPLKPAGNWTKGHLPFTEHIFLRSRLLPMLGNQEEASPFPSCAALFLVSEESCAQWFDDALGSSAFYSFIASFANNKQPSLLHTNDSGPVVSVCVGEVDRGSGQDSIVALSRIVDENWDVSLREKTKIRYMLSILRHGVEAELAFASEENLCPGVTHLWRIALRDRTVIALGFVASTALLDVSTNDWSDCTELLPNPESASVCVGALKYSTGNADEWFVQVSRSEISFCCGDVLKSHALESGIISSAVFVDSFGLVLAVDSREADNATIFVARLSESDEQLQLTPLLDVNSGVSALCVSQPESGNFIDGHFLYLAIATYANGIEVTLFEKKDFLNSSTRYEVSLAQLGHRPGTHLTLLPSTVSFDADHGNANPLTVLISTPGGSLELLLVQESLSADMYHQDLGTFMEATGLLVCDQARSIVVFGSSGVQWVDTFSGAVVHCSRINSSYPFSDSSAPLGTHAAGAASDSQILTASSIPYSVSSGLLEAPTTVTLYQRDAVSGSWSTQHKPLEISIEESDNVVAIQSLDVPSRTFVIAAGQSVFVTQDLRPGDPEEFMDDGFHFACCVRCSSKITALEVAPAHHLVLAGLHNGDGIVWSWNTERERLVFRCRIPPVGVGPVSSLSFHGDRVLVSAGDGAGLFDLRLATFASLADTAQLPPAILARTDGKRWHAARVAAYRMNPGRATGSTRGRIFAAWCRLWHAEHTAGEEGKSILVIHQDGSVEAVAERREHFFPGLLAMDSEDPDDVPAGLPTNQAQKLLQLLRGYSMTAAASPHSLRRSRE